MILSHDLGRDGAADKASKTSLRAPSRVCCTHEKPFTRHYEEDRRINPSPLHSTNLLYSSVRVTRWAQSWLNKSDRIIEGWASVRLIRLDVPVYTGFILENLIEFEGVAATQPDYHRINTLLLPRDARTLGLLYDEYTWQEPSVFFPSFFLSFFIGDLRDF